MPLNCQMNKMNIDVVITLYVHALKLPQIVGFAKVYNLLHGCI